MSQLKTFLSSSFLSSTSRLIGLANAVLIASIFGASAQMDTYVAASSIILAIKALINNSQSNTLIPFLSNGKRNYKIALSNLVSFNLVTSFFISILVVLFSYFLIILVAPGLESSQKQLASIILKLLAINVFLSNINAISRAILKIHGRLSITFFFEFVGSLTVLITLLIVRNKVGIFIFPITHLLSTIPYLVFSFLTLKKEPLKLLNPSNYNYKVIINYLKLLLPVISSWFFVWLIRFADNNIASNFDSGSMSYINYCTKIALFSVVIPNIICNIYFPLLSKLTAKSNATKFINEFYNGFTKLITIVLPISIILFIYSSNLISLLLENGNFTSIDSANVGKLLKGYIFLIFCAPFGSYFSNVFFAYEKPKIATIISILCSIINVILNIVLSQIWGLMGLAIASSSSYILGNIMQLSMIKKVNSIYKIRTLLKHSINSVIPAIISLIVGFYTHPFIIENFRNMNIHSKWKSGFTVSTGSLVILLVYTIIALIMGNKSIQSLFQRLRSC